MLGWVALALALLPAVMVLVNLRVFRAPRAGGGRPQVSVLIPARDEEANIGAACAAVLASEGVELELLVLDDGSTDATAAILATVPDPRLRVLTGTGLPPGWSGKQHACHVLGGAARFGLMVFVDADVRLTPDALTRMAGFMGGVEAGIASGFPRQVVVTWSERLLLPLIHFLLLGFLPMPLMQTRRDPGLGAGCGQLFIVRRDAYLSAGGHAAIRSSLHDGLTLPRAFRRAGFMSLLFDATGIATCRMYSNAGQVWEGLCKNATEGMATWRGLPGWTVVLGGGAVLPLILLLLAPSWPAGGALLLGLGTRLLLAWRFHQPVVSALLHPLGILGVLVVQWFSLLRQATGGRATWRGRAYTAQ